MKKQLQVGDNAPSIQAIDLWGNAISIPAKDKWFFLSFHRFAACPFCNLRINELIQHYEQFEKNNVEIVTIWPSDEEFLLRYAGSEQSPFPMLSDRKKGIYKAYGVTESSISGAMRLMLHPILIFKAIKNKHKNITIDADPNLMPDSFLIDTKGRIKMAYYGKHFGDHPKIESILSLAKNKL